MACDALCDAVDDAEVLLSRGTSLLHKVSVNGRKPVSVPPNFVPRFPRQLVCLVCEDLEATETLVLAQRGVA